MVMLVVQVEPGELRLRFYRFIYLFICEVEMGRIRESDMSSPQKIKNKNQKEERGKRKEGGMQANFENFEWQSESVSF